MGAGPVAAIRRFFRGTLPPQRSARRENCLSALARVFSRQRSEDVQGRKKILSGDGFRDHANPPHSHSIVLGGFELMSYTTRFTPRTSLMIRLEMRPSRSWGSFAQSAVIASSLVTARMTMTFS